MSIKDQIIADRDAARRAAGGAGADAVDATLRLSTLQSVLTAITRAEKAGKTAVELDDAAIFTVLRKEMKQRQQSALAYAEAGKPERAATETAEAGIIDAYLPRMLDADATRELVAAIVTETGASGPSGMKDVMQAIGKTGRTDVDRGLVSTIARELLAASA